MKQNKISAHYKLFLWGGGLALIAVLWLGGGFFNLVHNKLEIRNLTKKREQLDAEYQELLATKQLLENKDPSYMEMLARVRYHLVKPGEIEFRFTPHD